MTPPPPPEPSREWRLLTRELRALKDRSGLSMAALAARTTASKSSWQRYLSGTLPPPRELVRELCALTDEPPGRLLALWDLADAARRHAVEPGGEPEPGPEPGAPQEGPVPARGRLWGVAVGVVALALGGIGFVWLSGPDEGASAGGCRGAGCEGLGSQAQGCGTTAAEPRTVVERRVVGDRMVSVRHSAACDATWARVWFGRVGDRLEISAPEGRVQRVEIRDRYDAEGYLSTPMLAGGPDGTRACVVLAESGARHCVGG